MNVCNDKCPLEARVEALERDSEHNKDAHKNFYARLESSHTSVALIEERVCQIKEDTEEIKTSVQRLQETSAGTKDLKKDVEELKAKPGKRWDGIVEKAIWAVVAAVIAFLLARFGL